MREYHAAYYKQDDGWYVVSVLDFPGVHSQGKNLREARLMIKDALKLTIEYYLDHGFRLPKRKRQGGRPCRSACRKNSSRSLARHPVPT